MRLAVLAAALIMLLSSAVMAVQQSQSPQIKNYQTPGNLAGVKALKCGPAASLKNTDTPPDIYAGMVDCAKNGRYADAVFFFALAGTYTYFDSLRVADETAHQAHAVLLQESMEALDETMKAQFKKALYAMLGDAGRLPSVCTEISRVGAPNYFPRYMIQHGMGAVLGSNSSDGLVKEFNADAAWAKALTSYLHCPTLP